MIEEKLTSLKREYLKTEIPHYLKNYGWQNLESKLSEEKPKRFSYIPKKSFAFTFLSLSILLISTIALSQKSKPGQTLYPVKILSDQVYSQVTGDYEASIDKRAQEVIETSNNGESFDKASEEYQKALDEAKEKSKGDGEEKKEEFRKHLEEQENKFWEAQKEESEKSKKRLQEIQERTRRTRGEVKGSKYEKRENDNQKNYENQKDYNKNQTNQKDKD